MKKFFFFLVLFVIAFYLTMSFWVNFALIVRPSFGNTEAETLINMRNYIFHKGFENLILSAAVGSFFLSISFQFIFKNFKKSLLIFLLFVFISNIGNIWGLFDYYYGLQSEFKYRF